MILPGKFEHWPDTWWFKELSYCDVFKRSSYFIDIFLNLYG